MEFYLLLFLFLLVNLISVYRSFKQKATNADDYFLAGRSVKPILLFFTLVATNFSAFFFLGFAGEGYRSGFSYFAIMAFGTSFAALSFYLIGIPAWRLGKQQGYITSAELVGKRCQSRSVRILYACVLIAFTLPYLALQPIGAGYLINTLSGGQVPQFVGAALLTVFIVVYTYFGGMKSVAITDMVQGVLMFFLMFLAVALIADRLGGFEFANSRLFEIKPELFSQIGSQNAPSYSRSDWFSAMVLWFFCVPMFPQMFMRFFIADSEKGIRTSAILYAIVPLVLFIAPIVIGAWGHLEFPDLVGKEADRILPMMLERLLPPIFGSLIMIGALAAFMSTLDSQLLALSTIVSRDLTELFSKKRLAFDQEVRLGRISIIVFAALGLLISIDPPATILGIVKFAFTGYAALFPATLYAIRAAKPSKQAVFVSIAGAEAFLILHYLGKIPVDFYSIASPFMYVMGIAAILLGATYLICSKVFANQGNSL